MLKGCFQGLSEFGNFASIHFQRQGFTSHGCDSFVLRSMLHGKYQLNSHRASIDLFPWTSTQVAVTSELDEEDRLIGNYAHETSEEQILS
jgi:hypothetical protein